MHFKENYWYHIYNRGNNQQRIYFNHQNYLYFLQKIRNNILPAAHVLAYCLMPNHFHLLVHVKPSDTEKEATESHPLVQHIATLLSSYTRAINNQQNRSGSLFKSGTKAKNLSNGKRGYALTCFHYIHQNPVEAGLVENPEDWPYSSYRDYAGLRSGSLPAINFGSNTFGFADKQHFIKRSQQTFNPKDIDKIF